MDEDKKPTGKRFRRMENISSVFSSSDLNHRLFGPEALGKVGGPGDGEGVLCLKL